MKDQYVGDINDYLKYSVLRALGEAHTPSILVCWMLTADDGRRDGLKTSYLSQPARYRKIDPTLYDSLAAVVAADDRSTRAVERAGILPAPTSSAIGSRTPKPSARGISVAVWKAAAGQRDVFFDPDNGLDVPSSPKRPGRVATLPLCRGA